MITWVVIVVLLVGFFTMMIGINRGWWRGLDQWAFLHVTNQQDQRFWHQVAFWGQPWLTVVITGAMAVDHLDFGCPGDCQYNWDHYQKSS